ncbi:MAG: helicase-exonuclease AddAB subunit AddB [Lachnospiraceae bacterium]|nr:helicase-exonuclease AddAB subunit AddB [Lachnospiraceae bacterium]
MALQLILGNSGAGKSYYLFEKIIKESMEHPDLQYLVIVPEQFTMQTQKDLVLMHPCRGIMNIDVLSFERLAHRVFDEVGGEHRRILEDTGKNLILRRLAEEKKEELTILGGNMKKLGYISEVKSLISEFTQYRVSSDQLVEMMERNQNNPQLYFKLKDMKVLYDGFREYLEGTYLTAEELLGALEQTVERSESVRGSVIVLDGYTGFTPVQLSLLKKLLVLASEVYITLTMDAGEDPFSTGKEHELFYMTKKTIFQLTRLAGEVKVPVRKPVLKKDAGACRFCEAPGLHFLEEGIFRHRKTFWDQETNEICLYAAATPRAEAEAAGREIQRLVRDEGYRYRDMAVVTGDLSVYGTLMEQVFSRLGIPGFMDQKKDVLKNPFVEFLRALLSVIQEDFAYEPMFRLFRSGMTSVSGEETDLLENYVIARGIRGFSGWRREWKRPLKGMEEETLQELNGLRGKAVSGLKELREVLKAKNADAGQMTRGIYDYLVGLKIQQQLKAYEERFEKAGDYSRAKEYGQIYGMVMDLFDKLVMLLGDCKMSFAEYTELLDAGLGEMKVGLIPAGTDQVVVGDMERSRLKDIKVLFFVGINEGSVPKNTGRGGILSEMDRELLAEQEVELAPTSRQEAYIQKFYIYLNLTKPSQKLYLSWSLSDTGGSALRPSWLIAKVQELFPKVPIRTEQDSGYLERLVTPGGSIRELTDALHAVQAQKADRQQETLLLWYGEQKEWQELLFGLLDASCYANQETGIGRAVARALYGTLLEGSVTRLERFAACAYAHFLQYGLGLTERETCDLKSVDMGNVFHGALKYFSDRIEDSPYDWFHVPDQERDRWMEEALDQAMEDYGVRVLSDRAQDAYVMERVRRIGKRTAWAILKQLQQGAFVPEETEVSFRNLEQLPSVSMILSREERMRLQGRIDRIDVCRRDGKTYVRVVDYKSGNTRFDLTSIYYGLQLQLVVYLNAAMEKLAKAGAENEVHAAGMFYYHIKDPLLDYEESEDPQRRLLEELSFQGLSSGNPDVVALMDREAALGSSILPLRFKKDGGYTAGSSVAGEEHFARLTRHVEKKLMEYGERILKGDIRMQPYELGEEDACEYCRYHSVCGFDRKVEGCEKRRLRPMDKAEIWERLKEDSKDAKG